MPRYHFTTRWEIPATQEEVFDILNGALKLPLWWPAVYLGVEKVEDAEGEVYALFTKGWLPYTIRWQFRRTEKVRPERLALEAWGDLEGKGLWTFTQKGDSVEVVYDWQVEANKPLFRYFSFILKPIFSWNHHWAMKKGKESLLLELNRLRAGMSREEAPRPPLATFPHRRYYGRNLEGQSLKEQLNPS